MDKETVIRKLTSRKLWMAIALFVSGVMTAFGKESTAETVAGLIMQAAAVVGYIVGEGLVDAKNKPPDTGASEHKTEEDEDCAVTVKAYDDYYEDGSPREKYGVILPATIDEDGEDDGDA